MAKRIKDYKKMIDELLKNELPAEEWERIRAEHLIQVGFFQHERLIHLLVTLAFAIISMMTFFFCIMSFQPMLGLLLVALLCLLVPYIRHYYLLENEVQAMYEQYDEMVKRMEGALVKERKES